MEDLDYDEDLEDEDVKKEKEEAIGGELEFKGSNQLLRVDALFRAEGYDILVNILWVLYLVYIFFIGLISFESPTCFDILLLDKCS